MNAMVLKPDGKIYDPFGGKLDIYSKLIKTVGMPKDRIQEDPLRMLRAARFAARYGFDIDPNFIGKARQLADRIYDVSVERWVQELDKLLVSEYSSSGLYSLLNMGLYERIFPEITSNNEPSKVMLKTNDADLAWKQLLEKSHTNQKIARYMISGICSRLKFSNNRTKIVLGQVS
jgi:tRNA nucleotidyltransferase (CCA-adding enzyme)